MLDAEPAGYNRRIPIATIGRRTSPVRPSPSSSPSIPRGETCPCRAVARLALAARPGDVLAARPRGPGPATAAAAATPAGHRALGQGRRPGGRPGRAAQAPTDPIERIKDEALNKSQVMATLSYLTDVIGPRLTASPGMKRANEWTRDKLAGWGLENAHLEKWGPFGKGWTLKRFSIQVVEPQCIPLIAFPKAWSPGTDGPVIGEVVDLDAVKTEADLEKLKGKLKGAFVLLGPPLEVDGPLRAARAPG